MKLEQQRTICNSVLMMHYLTMNSTPEGVEVPKRDLLPEIFTRNTFPRSITHPLFSCICSAGPRIRSKVARMLILKHSWYPNCGTLQNANPEFVNTKLGGNVLSNTVNIWCLRHQPKLLTLGIKIFYLDFLRQAMSR